MSAIPAAAPLFDAAANNNQPAPGKTVATNILGLARISDDEHFARAMQSGTPLSYVAPRAGRMEYAGEDAMGAMNAESVMIRILSQPDYRPDAADVAQAHRINNTLRCAVEHMQRFYPDEYKRIAADLPKMYQGARRRDQSLSHC